MTNSANKPDFAPVRCLLPSIQRNTMKTEQVRSMESETEPFQQTVCDSLPERQWVRVTAVIFDCAVQQLGAHQFFANNSV